MANSNINSQCSNVTIDEHDPIWELFDSIATDDSQTNYQNQDGSLSTADQFIAPVAGDAQTAYQNNADNSNEQAWEPKFDGTDVFTYQNDTGSLDFDDWLSAFISGDSQQPAYQNDTGSFPTADSFLAPAVDDTQTAYQNNTGSFNIADDLLSAVIPGDSQQPTYQNDTGSFPTADSFLAPAVNDTQTAYQNNTGSLPTADSPAYQNSTGSTTPTTPEFNKAWQPRPIAVEEGVWNFSPYFVGYDTDEALNLALALHQDQAGSMDYQKTPVDSNQEFDFNNLQAGPGMILGQLPLPNFEGSMAFQPQPNFNGSTATEPPAQQSTRRRVQKKTPTKPKAVPGHVLARANGDKHELYRQSGSAINPDGSLNPFACRSFGSDPAPPRQRKPKGTGKPKAKKTPRAEAV